MEFYGPKWEPFLMPLSHLTITQTIRGITLGWLLHTQT